MGLIVSELVKRFQNLSKVTGTDKSSSYEVQITWTLHMGVYFELGTYDIGDWPRHTKRGPFDGEKKMLEALNWVICEAERIIVLEHDGSIEEYTHCVGCGCNIKKEKEYAYVLKSNVWGETGFGALLACIGCVEKELGRELVRGDFDSLMPLNKLTDYKRSDRLLNRLIREI